MSKPPPTCDICKSNVALYHCPRCGTSTCSLKCCQAHKTSTKDGTSTVLCNGKRDRTKFCSLKGFDDAQLASDYHFLEDVLKLSEGSKRLYDGLASGSSQTGSAKRPKANGLTPFRSTTDEMASINQEAPAHPLLQAKKGKSMIEVMANGMEEDDDEVAATGEECKALKICGSPDQKPMARPNNKSKSNSPKVDPLVRQAELKGVNLLRMPPGMQRRLNNTSKYNKKADSITWKIELLFHSKENDPDERKDDIQVGEKIKPTKFTVESSLADSSTLGQELGKHLDVLPGNASTRSTLKSFASVPRESLRLFMKCLPCSSVAPKYYQLDPDVTLVEALRGKTIIEYPTVEVVKSEDKDRFPLMISEMN